MDQKNTIREQRDVPPLATNRQLWPSLKFTPAGRQAVPELGVVSRLDQPHAADDS